MYFLKMFLLIFFKKREYEGERNINEKETWICCLHHTPHWSWSPRALTRNGTGDLFSCTR